MLEPYRVIVTGSRNWPAHRRDEVWEALARVAGECRSDRLVVVHGGCKTGVDFHARTWCENTPVFGFGLYVVEEVHRAAFKAQGSGAGPWRNRRMVDAGADLCLAGILPCSRPGCADPQPHGSHGATHCAGYAEHAGIPVRRITP